MSLNLTLRHGVGSFVQQVLPRRMQRLMLYSSLTAVLQEQPELDKQTLEKLNEVMRLSTDVDAMKFPATHMRRVIWKGEKPTEINLDLLMNSDQMDKAVSQTVARIPKFLRYGRQEDLRKEVEYYFQNCREFLSGKHA